MSGAATRAAATARPDQALAGQEMADQAAQLADQAAALADQSSLTPEMKQQLSQLKMQIDSADLSGMKIAAMDLANQIKMGVLPQMKVAPVPPMPPNIPSRFKLDMQFRDNAYNAGTRALDEHKYDEAVQRFDSAIVQDPSLAAGALYWKAYALNREGKRDDALAALAQLRRDYASSAWLHDAQALEAEVKQSSGQPISPAQESNDDLRLLAINSLMNADAERAIPLVEGILKGSATPSVKDRALFVLAQNKSPRARQALLDFAKGGGNPDLQLSAIRYEGMSGTKDAQQQLVAIYTASSDVSVKNAVLQALMTARATDALLSIAKSEKDASLRGSAIRNLANLTNDKSVPADELVQLYSGSDVPAKRAIVDSLMVRGDAKTLVGLARSETDPAMKKTIVERLASMRDNKDAMDYMMELLK